MIVFEDVTCFSATHFPVTTSDQKPQIKLVRTDYRFVRQIAVSAITGLTDYRFVRQTAVSEIDLTDYRFVRQTDVSAIPMV